jgi:hypothetical protein
MDIVRIQFLDENEVWQTMAFSFQDVDLEAEARRYCTSGFGRKAIRAIDAADNVVDTFFTVIDGGNKAPAFQKPRLVPKSRRPRLAVVN